MKTSTSRAILAPASYLPSLDVGASFNTKPSKKKKEDRPGTSDSSAGLLAAQWGTASSGYGVTEEKPIVDSDNERSRRHSLLYNHYEHSLNSLNDILDRVSC